MIFLCVFGPRSGSAFLLLTCLLCFLSPARASDWDVELEKLIGRQVAGALRESSGVDNDPLLTNWVMPMGQKVAAVSPRQDTPYTFTILGTDIANAFATPGGHIFVTRGLLDSIESDEELATVLAHEVGHHTKRHGMQQIGGNLLVLGLFAAFQGEKYRNLRTAGAIFNIFRTLHKSREMEAQADELGLQYASEAGYDPAGLITFFDGFDLRKRSPIEEYFSTHPAPAKRRETAQKSKYVTRQDLALREATARGYTERGYTTAAATLRRGADPLTLPALSAPALPAFLTEERKTVVEKAKNLRNRLNTAYKAQDIGGTLKQVLLINNQADFRWLYIATRAYAVQADVENLFARTSRVAGTAPATYEALAAFGDPTATTGPALDSAIGRTETRRALEKAEEAVVPIRRAAQAVTTVLVDLNNRFLRLSNEGQWLRYATLEGLLRYAESELARADKTSGQAWRMLSVARVRRYQHWLTVNVPETDVAKRALWADLAQRRFGTAFFPTTGPTGEATIRAALAVEKGEAAFAVAEGRGDTTWGDWVLIQKGIPENIATAMRLLVLDLEREGMRTQ